MEKIKNLYNNNTKEISLFVFAFMLITFMCYPLYGVLLMSGSLLIKDKTKSIIGTILGSIIYLSIEIILNGNFYLTSVGVITIVLIWLKQRNKYDNDYYHNKIIIYCLSFFLVFFSDFVFELYRLPVFFWKILTDRTMIIMIRIATFFLFVNIFNLCQKLKKYKLVIFIFTNLYFILQIINYWVYTITKKPLLISDFKLIKTAGAVMNGVNIDFKAIGLFIWMLILIILFNVILIKFLEFRNITLSKKTHMIEIFISIMLIRSFFFIVPSLDVLQFNTLQSFGFVGHLCVSSNGFKEPQNYKNFINLDEKQITEKTNKKKPNVIVIMSEAFSDLSLITNDLKTSTNYIPYTKSLMKNYPSGISYASVIGNNTVSSEFEFLTGIPTGITTKGATIYQTVMKDKTKSVISEFKDNGYKTIGVHPYHRIGYNRGNCWDLFGMDETYFETEFKNPKKVREFISDESFFDKIIELHKENKDQPLFIYGISMQNHATYPTDDFEKTEKNFEDDVNEYITLSNITDKELKKLIDYFDSVDEETVILYYGDHQPMIDYKFYEDLIGKDQDSFSNEEILKMYKVPYILWSNYDLGVDVPEETSICYLPGILFESIGFETSSWFDYVNKMKDKYPILTELFLKEKNGKLMETPPIKEKLDKIKNENSNSKYIDLKKYQSLGYHIVTETDNN